MTHKPKPHPENVGGQYFVTEDCLACENCQELAPNSFRYGENGLSYVFKQPSTSEEQEGCRMALESCPMEAIRDDGEK